MLSTTTICFIVPMYFKCICEYCLLILSRKRENINQPLSGVLCCPENKVKECLALVACWCRQVMAQAVTLRATAVFVLMHSGIVNGYQLLCDAHAMLERHRGTAAYLIFSLFSFSAFSFCMFVNLLTVPISCFWVPLQFVFTKI